MKVLWILLTAVCGTANAQGWIELGRNADAAAYTVGPPISSPSGRPAVWVYLDYASPRPNGALSTRVLIEADCANAQTRSLTTSAHTAPKARGEVIATAAAADWVPVPPSTFKARAWEYACTGK